ncbi:MULTISPECIES: response regulator transcription factor [Novosphingobium]|uniref:Response regulator n=1 Tax=Novosphingobium mangrovi (ex Huang et al. 2023) TaxID=2976432 RepID=A0ABT2I7Y8_9SPHN|nr:MULTISPECIES: response regulator [Novosphingobium]MCT2400911.1 response regulator [Novosphingobium mangrovi (ex Huang et al. 2023)]CCA93207.1 two component LuxR family transcriptional regulator [Novosphingobium sp. PP1Y]
MTVEKLVYIIDDDGAIRRSTSLFLRTQGYAVESYSSGVPFLEAAGSLRPGCVMLDVRMPEIDGIAVLEQMRSAGVDFPVVVMTAHGDVSTAVTAMRKGAHNFIEKPFEQDTILQALEEVFAVAEQADAQRLTAAAALSRIETLTPRERDVLEGLATGQTNKMIALAHGISPRTVEIHRANMMEKLGVRTLPEALRIALIAGLGTEP